jgi:hypothetical protein
MFQKFVIDVELDLFSELSKSSNFENVCTRADGRKGGILVNNTDLVPIVRTTTIYKEPAQKFLQIHYDIMNKIKEKCKMDVEFNNAMIEIYNPSYRKMGFHTDQALDLQDNSFICLFSCYENESNNNWRKLKIKNKITGKNSEVLLENNSAVLFSTSTNKKHLHKIVLESNTAKNRWLGITFRLSKTFVKFIDGVPHIYPGDKILRVANLNERKEFYKCKGKENAIVEYVYPEIDYTISESDIMSIK